jgi:hypothetical protein
MQIANIIHALVEENRSARRENRRLRRALEDALMFEAPIDIFTARTAWECSGCMGGEEARPVLERRAFIHVGECPLARGQRIVNCRLRRT